MTSAPFHSLLELRLLVGFLGERPQFGWWPSSFFEPAAMQFLEPVFGRTARLAQYNGVREAARRVHDERVGVGPVFHLFRLPQETEQDLHQCTGSLGDAVLTNLGRREDALGRLGELSGGQPAIAEGPQAVGSIGDASRPASLKTLASLYLGAFNTGIRVYPYFTA